MSGGFGLDQLGRDPNLGAELADAAFEHISHAELAADLLCVDCLTLEREGGVSRDYDHARYAGQFGRQIFGNTVGEKFPLGIVRQVNERQDDDGQARRARL